MSGMQDHVRVSGPPRYLRLLLLQLLLRLLGLLRAAAVCIKCVLELCPAEASAGGAEAHRPLSMRMECTEDGQRTSTTCSMLDLTALVGPQAPSTRVVAGAVP